ncbi:aldehyde ferredoxin oxidoreductase family protein [Thermosphaera sp.]
MKGVWGRLLEVDLTTGSTHAVEIPEKVYRMFLGGRGLATYLLAKEFGAKWRMLDPLSPENPLMLLTGPLTGYHPGVKLSVSGKSPQSNSVVGSVVSSEVAVELKASGFDGLVLKGSCEKPCYIYVENGRVYLREASAIWGLGGLKLIEKFYSLLREDMNGEPGTPFVYIGPAGENRVRTAAVMAKLAHAAGYGGYGAVMGVKKVKAIAVKGYGRLPPVNNPESLTSLFQTTLRNVRERMKRFRQWGTTEGTWYTGYYLSSMPVRNWQEEWHDVKNFSHVGFELETWVKNPWADWGCPVACMKLSLVKWKGESHLTDNPDYEMAAYLGSNLGVFNPKEAVLLSSLADELGLCGIQTGNVMGFAVELYEKGVINKDEVGYDLKWGDVECLARLMKDIAHRRGIGEVLAEGTYRAARILSEKKGLDLTKYAVQVKGIAVGAHGVRSGKDYPQPVSYALSVQGGDHTSVAGFPVDSTESETWYSILDSGVVCMFTVLDDAGLLEFLNNVTGWGLSLREFYNIGRRIITLQRILLLLGGPDAEWSVRDDDNPPRFYEPLPTGPYKGSSIRREEVEELRKKYYNELGWDEEGIPTEEALRALGLEEFLPLLGQIRE